MTPRKELFIRIKEVLKTIPELELIDLERNQFGNKDDNSCYWTAALIEIKSIKWESMTENKQEGECKIDVILYTQDGWLDQHDTTTDEDHGLTEIDLQDTMVEKLQFLKGEYFKPLQLINETTESTESIMSYRLTFNTLIYRRINPLYSNKKITIKKL